MGINLIIRLIKRNISLDNKKYNIDLTSIIASPLYNDLITYYTYNESLAITLYLSNKVSLNIIEKLTSLDKLYILNLIKEYLKTNKKILY